jgi:hypothetical protein
MYSNNVFKFSGPEVSRTIQYYYEKYGIMITDFQKEYKKNKIY